jgi:predicted Zn-dependent peptidase
MNRMTRIAKGLLMYNEIVTPDEVIKRIYAVTPDMVHELAKRTFESGLFSMAAIGDKEVLPQVQAEFVKWWRN